MVFASNFWYMLQFDNGITGGVTSMPAFLQKFFPDVYHHTQNPGHGDSAYCKYNNQGLQLFTSCLFIAAAFSSLVGGYTTRSALFVPYIVHHFRVQAPSVHQTWTGPPRSHACSCMTLCTALHG